MTVDRTLSTPLHVQVEQALLEDLDAGTWAPGERVPTEPELAARFGVNRLTVREAIASLRRTGHLVARQGAGTFVAQPPMRVDVDPAGLPTDTTSEGFDPSFSEEILDVRRVVLHGEARRELGIDEGVEIETLASMGGSPVMHTVYALVTDLSADEVRRRCSSPWIPTAFPAILGTEVSSAWRAFDAIAAERHEGTLLGVEQGAPLLRRSGTNVDPAGTPLTYHVRAYRSDRMRIMLRHQKR
ncbi:GntR family transcriptional regulator [Demequina salsinemoris]|uniref:GntR family transcriptional regulator n=1 Tax=Demequina salsinemoris TaxID=577470 RepID=UPI00078639C8|nr:GntR family transcriptional regulator [Demequina salsinemoris]